MSSLNPLTIREQCMHKQTKSARNNKVRKLMSAMFKKKTSPRKLPGLRDLLSRHRAITSPVDTRAPIDGFHTASCSEPDLTIHDMVDQVCPMNTLTLRHVKSDGFSSNEHLEYSELCQLQQFSHSSSSISLSSNPSLHEASTEAQEETDFDFVPRFLLRKKFGNHVKSASDALNEAQNSTFVRKKYLYGHPRPLSSPDIAVPLPIHQIEAAYTKTPSSEGVSNKIPSSEGVSNSHTDLSPATHKESPRKTSSFLNLHKSFASAWQIFRPKNKRKLSAQDLPPPPSYTRQDTTTLAEYCEQQELQLTSSDNDEFCVIPTGSASIQFLAPQRKLSESELEREELLRLAIAELEAHTNEHLQWRERKLRPTSMWSTSGVILPPADPFEIQFECEVLYIIIRIYCVHGGYTVQTVHVHGGYTVQTVCMVGTLYRLCARWVHCTDCVHGGYTVQTVCMVGTLYRLCAWWVHCTDCVHGGCTVQAVCMVGALYRLCARWVHCTGCVHGGCTVQTVCMVGTLYRLCARWVHCTGCVHGGCTVQTVCTVGTLYRLCAWWVHCTDCVHGGYTVVIFVE